MTAETATRFPILFTGANRSMAVLGMTPASSWVDVGATDLHVQMGWAFRLSAPRAAVRSAAPDTDRVLGWGVHGWRGRWLVNGSSSGLVRIELTEPVRAWVSGFPVRLHTLRVSVVDPEGLIDALRPDAP